MPNNRITRLDPSVASQLRSNVAIYNQGQAIEELVLNSVDAGSTIVDVLVDAPNFSFEVRDNGSGMDPDDLKMVGEQNATSKLTSFGDEVVTNGFRGEALSSIATISCMEVVTKTSASHTVYSKMIQGGTVLSFGPATSGTPMTRPHGTTIYVRDLFFKWPVRKKILMASNEMEDIKQRMEAIALAHPNLAFSLYDRAKGVKLMQSKKEQSLLGCFAHLFGIQRVENLCEIRGNTLSPAKLKLSGFASSPFSAGHHSKVLQFMYINRRKVKHSPIQSLLSKLYAVHMDRQPIYVLFLECSSLLYDVCYEPDKTKIEFSNWTPVLDLVESSFSFMSASTKGKSTTVTVDKWAVTTFNNKSEFEVDDPKMAVLDDESDDSISCSPAILTLHTSHPSSSPQSSSSSSSSSDAQTLPVPISIPHEHRSQTRKRALSAPPYYKPSQLTVHNNPTLSITHSPPKNPPPTAKLVPPKLVIAPPKSATSPPQQKKETKAKKVIDISDDASDDEFSRKANNNNDNSSDNKSDDSDNSAHSSSSSRSADQDTKYKKKNYNNSKLKKHDKSTNNINKFKYKPHSENKYESDESDEEVARIDFGLSSSDSSDAENTKKMKEKQPSNKNESHSSSSSSKNKRKHNSDDDVAHHCHHSDGDYADPDPKPTKKYKKGMKKWDQKRHFTVPTFGDEDAPDDSYAAKVKRSIDEIYRIPDDGETPISISKDTVREMYVVGQADNKFVVTRAGNILFMVDQHAADERVRLERLETAVGSASGCGQFTLSKPQKWALAPHEARAAESYKSQLENWGFRWDVSSSDDNMLIVRQIPTLFDTKLTMHDFREFIAQLDETKGSNHTRPNAITRILNFKACRGAVMFGDPLSQAECGVLIDQVSQCKLPFQCAHGRPSMHPVIDMTKLPPTPPPRPRRGLGGLLLLPPP